MPIILAIEPDRRQAAHLAGVVRQRVGAELILADTTERALDAIGNRVPDMVLVPALLSPQDDAALAAALRVIAAAAHVRTLTIPVLASGTKRTTRGGMLAKWRRGRGESPAPEGCDPAVFAEQITAYLQEAAAERAELETETVVAAEVAPHMAAEIETAPIRDAQPIELATPDSSEPLVAATLVEAEPAVQFDAPPELIVSQEVAPSVAVETESAPIRDAQPIELATPDSSEPLVAAAVVQAEPPVRFDALPEITFDSQPVIDLSEELADLSEEEETGEELFAGEPVGIYTISAAEEPALEAFDLLPAVLEPPPIAQSAAAPVAEASLSEAVLEQPFVEAAVIEAAVVEAAVIEEAVIEEAVVEEAVVEEHVVEATLTVEAEPQRTDVEPWVGMYLTPGRLWPALEGVLAEPPPPLEELLARPEPEPIAAMVQHARTVPPDPPPAAPSPKPERPEWADLVASLRQDIERRRAEATSAAAPTVAARPMDSAGGHGNRPVKKQKMHARKSKSLQDEWGFFDPEQCGFSALLAKLDEITDGPEESGASRPS